MPTDKAVGAHGWQGQKSQHRRGICETLWSLGVGGGLQGGDRGRPKWTRQRRAEETGVGGLNTLFWVETWEGRAGGKTEDNELST